jgi:adenylyltransferase/sulfurtransferase
MSNPMFRTMRLRQKKKDCAVCGENPTITELIDYVQFCQGQANDDVTKTTIIIHKALINFLFSLDCG